MRKLSDVLEHRAVGQEEVVVGVWRLRCYILSLYKISKMIVNDRNGRELVNFIKKQLCLKLPSEFFIPNSARTLPQLLFVKCSYWSWQSRVCVWYISLFYCWTRVATWSFCCRTHWPDREKKLSVLDKIKSGYRRRSLIIIIGLYIAEIWEDSFIKMFLFRDGTIIFFL